MRTATRATEILARALENIAPRVPMLIQTKVYPIGQYNFAVDFTYAEDSATEPGKQHVTRACFDGTRWI